MKVRRKSLVQVIVSMAVTVSLAACVTTKGRVFTAEASPEAALKTRTELARSYIRAENWDDAKRNLKLAA